MSKISFHINSLLRQVQQPDLQLVQAYCDLIGFSKSPIEYLQQNDKLVVKEGDKYRISAAAILLFGRKPQDFFPRAQVRFIKYQGRKLLPVLR